MIKIVCYINKRSKENTLHTNISYQQSIRSKRWNCRGINKLIIINILKNSLICWLEHSNSKQYIGTRSGYLILQCAGSLPIDKYCIVVLHIRVYRSVWKTFILIKSSPLNILIYNGEINNSKSNYLQNSCPAHVKRPAFSYWVNAIKFKYIFYHDIRSKVEGSKCKRNHFQKI